MDCFTEVRRVRDEQSGCGFVVARAVLLLSPRFRDELFSKLIYFDTTCMFYDVKLEISVP